MVLFCCMLLQELIGNLGSDLPVTFIVFKEEIGSREAMNQEVVVVV